MMMQADTWLFLVKGASPWEGDAELGALFCLSICSVSRGGVCPCAGSGPLSGDHCCFWGRIEMVGVRVSVSPALCLFA